jgi:hypothetical protein
MTILTSGSRQLGFSRADEIAIVFCGSKKSLVNGVPIATLLFGGHGARCHPIDGVPSDSTHGLRVARTTLRSTPGHGAVSARGSLRGKLPTTQKEWDFCRDIPAETTQIVSFGEQREKFGR